MNTAVPIAVIFPPAPELSQDFQALLSRLNLPTASCPSVQDLPLVIAQHPESIPVICMPFALSGGRSGVNETLLIREQVAFRDIKILGLLTLLDKISLHSFYGAGADTVLIPPLDIDLISLQLHALAKATKELQMLHLQIEQDREITRSTMRFLDATRDGVVIVAEDYSLVVANRAAERILALQSSDGLAAFTHLAQQFTPYLDRHRQQEIQERSVAELVSSADVSITRVDGRTTRLLLRIMSLKGKEQQAVGFAIGIGDLSIPRQLANKLSNQERIRPLTLTLAAAALELLNSNSLGVPGHPMKMVEHSLQRSKTPVLLSEVVTPLLEVLDLVLPPHSEIRVSIRDDAKLLATRAELFQLLGSLLLFAADRAGADGETTIESLFDKTGEYLTVVFSYTAHEVVEPISGDYFATLLHGDHGRFLEEADCSVQPLKFAQQCAQKLAIQIEVSASSKWSGKFRVLLPCEIG